MKSYSYHLHLILCLTFLMLTNRCGKDGDDDQGGKKETAKTTAPTAPSSLSATAISTTQIDLSWKDNSDNETGFKLERSLDGSSGWTEVASLTANTTTYQNTGLTAATTYYYRVCAYNSGGNSGYTPVVNAKTNSSPPAAPSALSGKSMSATQINLSWTDNSNDESGFKVEFSLNGTSGWAEIATVNANTTTYQHTGLTSGTKYYYRVCAYNAIGNSEFSNILNITAGASAPSAPTNLAANVASATQINLSWTDNSNNETGFKVERSFDGSTGWAEIAALAANTTTYQNTGLVASTKYYYRVYAYNAGGNSEYSNIPNATTSAGASVPAAPTNLTATAASATQINLAWADKATDETGYKVEWSSNGTSGWTIITTSLGANTTSFQHTGLTAGTTYYYRVYAYNANGNSEYSNITNAATQSSGTLPTLTTSAVTSYTSTTAVMGGNITNAGTPTYTERGVCFATTHNPTTSNNKTAISGTGTGTFSASVTSGLAANTLYYVRAYAINSAGVAYGSEVSFTTQAAQAAPILTGPSTTASVINLSWTYNWPQGIVSTSDHYQLESSYSATSGFTVRTYYTYEDRRSPFTEQITPVAADVGKTIYFRVRALSGGSFTPYSNVVGVYVESLAVAPNAPSNLVADATSPTSVKLTWTDNSNNETGFEIQRASTTVSGQWVTVYTTSANATSYTHTGLNETHPAYRIRAVNGPAYSSYSNQALPPAKLRIINNLYNDNDANGWKKLNGIISVAISPTNVDIETNAVTYEKYNRNNYLSLPGNIIYPCYTSTPTSSNYADFPVGSYGYGANYKMLVICGWWDYFNFSWQKHYTTITRGTKGVWATTTNHASGYHVVTATQIGLPLKE